METFTHDELAGRSIRKQRIDDPPSRRAGLRQKYNDRECKTSPASPFKSHPQSPILPISSKDGVDRARVDCGASESDNLSQYPLPASQHPPIGFVDLPLSITVCGHGSAPIYFAKVSEQTTPFISRRTAWGSRRHAP